MKCQVCGTVFPSQHQQQSCKHRIPTFCLTGLQIGKHVVSFRPHSYQYNLVVFIFMLSWWFVTDPILCSLSLSRSKWCLSTYSHHHYSIYANTIVAWQCLAFYHTFCHKEKLMGQKCHQNNNKVTSNTPKSLKPSWKVLTGPFLACITHSCLLCQLCLEHCFETVRMRLKVTQSIVEVMQWNDLHRMIFP